MEDVFCANCLTEVEELTAWVDTSEEEEQLVYCDSCVQRHGWADEPGFVRASTLA